MTDNGRAWLSAQGYQQALDELDRLLLSHRSGPPGHDGDEDAWARHGWRERRIRHLQELVLGAAVGGVPPDDGVAEPGMVLTVRLDDATETETFLLAESGVPADREIDVYSPASPVGRAVLGAQEGDTRRCRLPDGHTVSITLVAAKPYDQG
ncbi:GreA/GreB family elongation factor [Actinomycetospora straminea]|uniref:Transcription elongation factor GreA n=1 Tax=Actinomycetospora straminea TaxID=663607 RepID=A0ABP9EGM1_9PSEU|nr:GreA/GreB family elongation factor [Actinomycetospora straminea]MDD7935681.1 GreA/GreB family elongation factor [Actinomycetospora straminea]